MVQQKNILSLPILWRGKKFVLELDGDASFRELGEELQKLTDVKADTMRLIIPQSSTKSPKLWMPFSDEHSCLKLQDIGILEGKPLRMMGVSEHEVDQFLEDAKANLRIAGFDEEEKRMKQRISGGAQVSLKLPQGPYIFCDFRTLELPGIELNPPPSEALKRMHMLAADPGIVAIMNKHRWRVGIMTEMAPVGYVGISPKCLLGFNKNQGEEISLRIRTDDLKGFRKYESIKKTLLHELAHMVYSEHDANFYALDKQLNQEAFALDWTRSRSHTLTGTRFSGHDDFEMGFESESNLVHKLGGQPSHMAASAREASVTAAYHRLAESPTVSQEQDYGGYTPGASGDSNPVGPMMQDSETGKTMNLEPHFEVNKGIIQVEPIPNDIDMREVGLSPKFTADLHEEPDPDDSEVPESNSEKMTRNLEEPDPDDFEARNNAGKIKTFDGIGNYSRDQPQLRRVHVELDPDGPREIKIMGVITNEPDPDDEELRRIQDPVTVFCNRLTGAIEKLRTELKPSDAMLVIQTLFKIIRNISENPNEMKYKKLRKENPTFQRSIAYYKAAMEVLFLVGFSEEVVVDQTGKSEIYLVLKRNDPALLWLSKSTLETCIA